MRITTIPNLYGNVKRWTEILAVLSRYGLADWISRQNIDFFKDKLRDRDGEALARLSQARRIRLAMAELGPTFVKLGQLLSTRADVVGVELAWELEHLQCDVRADPFEDVKRLVEEELGNPLETLFQQFDEQSLASASIGQVHRGRLHDGRDVAVKVQHQNIETTVRRDLEVLAGLAALAERIPELAAYRPRDTSAELGRALVRELDFGREERNLQQFCTLLGQDPRVVVPRPVIEYCTSRILTMEFIQGQSIQSVDVENPPCDLKRLARDGAELYMEMIFTHGFFHADPHPGNILITPEGRIGLLDFGQVGRIDEQLRESIEEMLMAIVQQDVAMLAATMKRVGRTPPDLDEGLFSVDLADFVGAYASQGLDHFDLAGALSDMMAMINRHRIIMPAQAILLIKVLITLEGTARKLSPQFSLVEVMRPYHRKMLIRRLSPTRQLRKLRRFYLELERLAEVLPNRMVEILEQVRSGKFYVHLDHRGLEPSVNRLALALLASAMLMGSAQLLSSQVPPLLFPERPFLGMSKLSLLGLFGGATSIMLGLRLIRAISKSGHLD